MTQKATEKAAEAKGVKVRLTSRYWDGRILHQPGTVLTFPEGKAPKSAKPVE